MVVDSTPPLAAAPPLLMLLPLLLLLMLPLLLLHLLLLACTSEKGGERWTCRHNVVWEGGGLARHLYISPSFSLL